jgi:hypothetical protein
MESTRSRVKWKEIVVVLLALALLVFLLWLFLRPAQPARDIVFGDLGRRPATNVVTETLTERPVPPEMPTNASPTNEQSQNDHSAGRTPNLSRAAQQEQGTALSNSNSVQPSNASPEINNSASSSASNQAASPTIPLPPSPSEAHASARTIHNRPVPFEENYPLPPEPAHKASTAALLAAAKEAGRGPDRPSPARTADLLGDNGAPSRVFDAEAGSNVVFILNNSLSMMTNGKSIFARQAVAEALESMNANQTFYVLLFHSGGYEGMPSLGPVPGTPENVRAMTNWLFNVGHRAGADPTKAVQRALGLARAPDLVWLLSDSAIPEQVVDGIREANASVNAHINTIGFYSKDGEQGLRRVADENRGVYRYIPPPNAPVP